MNRRPQPSRSLHRLVERGDAAGLRDLLNADHEAIDAVDHAHRTPLSLAVTNPRVPIEVVRLRLEHRASVNPDRGLPHGSRDSLIADAISAGDPKKVAALIEAEAYIKFLDADGYDALIVAVHGRDVLRDSQLLDLLDLLIAQGVALSRVSN